MTAPRASSEETGRELGGRYRLVAPIGSGSSARVYLAIDSQKQRNVAVKVLHDELANDDAFLRRFRAEARIAAALSHPNIQAVYGSGEDTEGDSTVAYLVTEYLDGGSVGSMLGRGTTVSSSQALVIGLGASRALAHAHQRGLVHRDVKPANLLFSRDGRLRVADFGLARALAEASRTDPSRATADGARYWSPEDVSGGRPDGRSDVYSLALVLAECVTGAVPATGDTPASTLSLRLDGDLEVDPAVGAIRRSLERALRVDPAERPDAVEFEISLMAAAESLPRPQPLPLVVAPDPADDPAHNDPAQYDPALERAVRRSRSRTRAAGSDRDGPVVPPRSAATPERPAAASRRRHWAWLVPLLLVLIAGVGAGWWFLVRTPTLEVPDFIGQTVDEASAAARDLELQVDSSERVRVDGTVAGDVVGQDPAAATSVAEGTTVRLTVSDGPTLSVVPKVAGQTQDQATATVQQAGFTVGAVTTANDENVAKGAAVSAAPSVGAPPLDALGQLPKGSSVDLVMSDGPAPRAVPDGLVGVTQAAAAAKLASVGLYVAAVPAFSDTVPSGLVISSSPPTGTQLPRGTQVQVVVSQGPAPAPA